MPWNIPDKKVSHVMDFYNTLAARLDVQAETIGIMIEQVREIIQDVRVLQEQAARPHVTLADLTKRIEALEATCQRTMIADNKWQNSIEHRLEKIDKGLEHTPHGSL